MKDLANRLRQLRQEHGLSQEDLAAHLHVSRQAVSKWERGEALPDTENLIMLAKLYHISLDALVGLCSTEGEPICMQHTNEKEKEILTAPSRKPRWRAAMQALPYPILATILFLLLGFLADAWAVSWILFVTIPVYYSIVECIEKRRFSEFAYPVFITCIFLYVGMQWDLWHPMWIVYLTIPIYYSIADAIDRITHPRQPTEKNAKDDEEDDDSNGTTTESTDGDAAI